MKIYAAGADLLRSLHIPGDPLIRQCRGRRHGPSGAAPGGRGPRHGSHSTPWHTASATVKASRPTRPSAAAAVIVRATHFPVSVDLERGDPRDAAGDEAERGGGLCRGRCRGRNVED